LNPPEDFEGSIDISLQPLAQKLQSSQGNARFCQCHCEAWGRFEEKPGRNDDHQSPLTPAFAWRLPDHRLRFLPDLKLKAIDS